jgi:peptidoglycan-N-acetylglucosamine deacetylase
MKAYFIFLLFIATQSFISANPGEFAKQFPDEGTNYDNGNRNHRGMSQYRAISLHQTRTLSLTFDDGPHPQLTPKLLDILKLYQVKATFFVLGENAKKYPKIIQRIVSEGHTLASHDMAHDNSNSESEEVFANGLKKSILLIKSFDSSRESYYRFPYGAYGSNRLSYHHFNTMKDISQELFGENCINFAFWDIDTSDWVSNMTAQNIVQTLWANLNGGRAYTFVKKTRWNGKVYYTKKSYSIRRPSEGGVVLMHDIHKRTIEATKIFLKEASTQNIQFVLLPEIREFEYGNKVCDLRI